MKIKNFLIIFTLFMVLCGVSAVSAASDNAVDNLTSDMDDSFLVSNNLNAVGVDESASVAQENDDGLFGQSQTKDENEYKNENSLSTFYYNDDNFDQYLLLPENAILNDLMINPGDSNKNPNNYLIINSIEIKEVIS